MQTKRRKRKRMRLKERERDVVQVIRQGLERLGYRVLHCGQQRADKSGSDPGLPDLFVSHPRWPAGVWIGLECKSTVGRLSTAQRALAATRRIVIVRNWEDALSTARETWNALQSAP